MKETLKLFQKHVSAKIKKLIKGLCLSITILFISLCITPIQIYASEQTQIVPTWNWGSQYANQFTVTNFCEGSGTSASCELRFTANNSYYGYLSFDGYNGNTKWINYKNVWIADGYGAYRYSLYQNGVIQINKINIEGGFLKSSMDNLDLQDIIDLLTAIETDTTSIDNQINTQLQRIQSIINNQITANGYLDVLTKIRNYNMPFESFPYVMSIYQWNSGYIHNFPNNTYFDYPVFDLPINSLILRGWKTNDNRTYTWIFSSSRNIRQDNYTDHLNLPSGFELISWENLDYISFGASAFTKKVTFRFTNGGTSFDITNKTSFDYFVPIFYRESTQMKNLSTEFALRYGLSNQFINDLHIIAQGTTESNSAATGLDSETSSFESVASGLYTSENSFNQNMNSSLQSIDTSFNPSTSFGSKFLYSADWVRSQFNTITSNTPFGSVLSFSMLLGLSLLIIGKVFK